MTADAAAFDPLRVALLGYGLAGRVFHGPLVAATPGLRLAAVVTTDAGRAAQARADHPGVRVLPSTDDVWADPGSYDLVVVATGNDAHVPQAGTALAHGLHVVVDKPLAPDAAAAEALVAAADRHGRQLHVFQNRRWDSDVLTIRALVAAGRLGRVHRLESRFERWRPAVGGGWRETGRREQLPGLLYDLGSHLVDQALHLLGPVSAVHAQARSVRLPGGPDDDTQILLRHVDGAVSLLWASAVSAFTGPRFRVLGTAGGFQVEGLDGQEDALRAGRRPGHGWGQEPPAAWGTLVGVDGSTQRVPAEPGRWPDYYRAVVAAIRTGAPPPVDPWDVVADLRVLDAARRSAADATVVVLDPPAGHRSGPPATEAGR